MRHDTLRIAETTANRIIFFIIVYSLCHQKHQKNTHPDNQELHRLDFVVENSSMNHSKYNNVASPSKAKFVQMDRLTDRKETGQCCRWRCWTTFEAVTYTRSPFSRCTAQCTTVRWRSWIGNATIYAKSLHYSSRNHQLDSAQFRHW